IYRQIEQFLREQLQSGTLNPDTRLPSSRELATNLGVSRIVVANAYAELESHGLIYSRRGSGTYVAPPVTVPAGAKDDFISAQDWPLWQQELLSQAWQPAYQELDRMLKSVTHPDLISFAERIAANALWPADDFRKALQAVLRQNGIEAVGQSSYYRPGPGRGRLPALARHRRPDPQQPGHSGTTGQYSHHVWLAAGAKPGSPGFAASPRRGAGRKPHLQRRHRPLSLAGRAPFGRARG
ncbi:MAG: GntR family transcriptional regulator, partial [Delftia sp.]|nr:GntR family transcriptional regulator [Delftia sp.]